MKKQMSVFVTLAMMLLFAGSVFAQKEVIKTEKIKVGIDCPMGKATIEKELVKTSGVKTVDVNMETKIASISYVEGKTSKDQLVSAIEKLGYKTEFSKSSTPVKTGCSKSCAKTCGH
jgi:periplasmic mercuric ion binding protein